MNCAICSGSLRSSASNVSGSITYTTQGSEASALPERAWLPTNSASSPKYSSGPISLSGRSPANSSSTRPDAITNMLRPNSPRRNTARPGPNSSRWPTLVNNAISRSDNRRGNRPMMGVSGAEPARPATFLLDRTLYTTTPQFSVPDDTPAQTGTHGRGERCYRNSHSPVFAPLTLLPSPASGRGEVGAVHVRLRPRSCSCQHQTPRCLPL